MHIVTLARHLMATRFELVLHGENSVALRAAGEEALDEITRLEAQLSLYRPTSEIARLNARAAHEAVRVTPELFALLSHAKKLSGETGGAFDITIAPLVRCWGFMGASGKMPTAEAVAEARAKVGMEHVQLDAQNLAVRFAREGVMLDLGAIGKGYAVERAAAILREAGVASALVHGGTSTVHAIGAPPDAEHWTVAVEKPPASSGDSVAPSDGNTATTDRDTPDYITTILLRDEAMSVSSIRGRAFTLDGKTFGHVLDPRSGQPVSHAQLAVVVLPSATETDALSTALLILGAAGHDLISGLRPGMRTLLAAGAKEPLRVEARGISVESTV